MPRNFPTRLGLYATLALAALCLAAAEQPFFPWCFACAVPMLALMALGLLIEGRWILPIWAANILGLAIAGVWGVWIDLRVFGDSDLGLEGVPLPAALLPDVGPLLAVLIVALLFRPKQQRDYWILQGLGLLEVALGCVLASGPLFGGLLCAYLAVGLWSLALFNLHREPGRAGPGTFWPGTGGLRWLPAVLGMALALFLVLPRTDGQPWDATRLGGSGPAAGAAAETGATEEMDLNRTGWVQINDELAFQARAEDAARRPKTDLPPGQHWRGRVVDDYDRGRWTASYDSSLAFQHTQLPMMGPGEEPAFPLLQQRLCDLGPEQFFLDFEVDPRKAGGLFLADPVVIRSPDGRSTSSCWVPSRGLRPPGPLFIEVQGTLVAGPLAGGKTVHYRQVTLTPEDDLSVPLPPGAFGRGYLLRLCRQPVPGLTDWTRERVRELAAGAGAPLRPADLVFRPAPGDLRVDHPDGVLSAEKWEPVARALCAYLARSGEYTYTLERRRKDRTLDPTFDFLANVKEGHCERYAGGLALMLRALGIPARVVLGYRGANGRGDGSYEVLQSQAHAWVECLVVRNEPGGGPGLYWLELDPTPAGEAPRPPPFDLSAWRDSLVAAGQGFWKSFILDYNPGQQEDVWSRVAQALRRISVGRLRAGGALGLGAAVLAGLLAAMWLARRVGRRRAAPGTVPLPSSYRRLLAILARRRRLHPGPAQTPREFAEAARSVLAADPVTAALAGVPRAVADLLYRARFGARPLTAEEERIVDGDLDRLDAALAGRGYNDKESLVLSH